MKWVGQNAKRARVARRGQQIAIILRFWMFPGRRQSESKEVSRRRADFLAGNYRQIRRIFRKLLGGQRHIVIGNCDKREMGLLGRMHYICHGTAAIRSFRVNVNHANSLVRIITLGNGRQLDGQPFHKDSGDHQEQNQERCRQDSVRSFAWHQNGDMILLIPLLRSQSLQITSRDGNR